MPQHSRGALSLLAALVVALGACSGPPTPALETTASTVSTSPSTASPPATAPVLELPAVGPDAWDRSDIPDDVVVVEVGTNPQTLIDDNPPGTAFLFVAGVHARVEITRLKDGTSIYGEPGAVLDGDGTAQFAIVAYGEPIVSDVVIKGLIVENYSPPEQLAPVGGGFGDSWIVEYNEIRESAAAGLQLGNASIARYNHVHHNRQIGIKTGSPTQDVLIAENEVSFNNYEDEYEYAVEAGGMKIVNSEDVTIIGNYVHDNHGPGIWTDGNNIGSRIERNTALDNYGPGIFHEISYDATIVENIVERNAFEFYLGGILIASSSGVEVFRNSVVDNDGGIVAIQEDRGGGDLGEFVIERLFVHDNLVRFSEGRMGVLDNVGDGVVFGRDIVFASNTYDILEADDPFTWVSDGLSYSRWLELHPSDR